MTLIPWKHKNNLAGSQLGTGSLSDLRHEVDRLFEDFLKEPFGLFSKGGDLAWMPTVDVVEDGATVTIKAELAGIEPENVEISVSGNILTIAGEKKEEQEQKEKDYHFSERRFGSFRRQLDLPQGVDVDSLTADYKNGLLTITAKKTASAMPKSIPIKANEAGSKS